MAPKPAETDTSALCTPLILPASCGLHARNLKAWGETHLLWDGGCSACCFPSWQRARGSSCSHLCFLCHFLGCQRWSCWWWCCFGRGEGHVEELLTETVVKSLLSLGQRRRPCLILEVTKFSLALDAERPWACRTPSYTLSGWHCRSNVAVSSHLLVLHEQGVICCFFRFAFLGLICFSEPACYLLSRLRERTDTYAGLS